MKLLHEAYQRCPLLDEDARRDLVEKTQLLPKWVRFSTGKVEKNAKKIQIFQNKN